MNKYLDIAVSEASKSRCKQRHGCIIVYNGNIISRATNVMYPQPMPDSNSWRISVHAEMAAINKLGTVPNGARLYVARLAPSGKVSASGPCTKCWSLIKRTGIKAVFWT